MCCSLVEYKNRKYLDQWKWDNTFQKQPSRRVFQICVWQIWLELFKNIFEGVSFSREFKKMSDRYISKIFPVVQEVAARNWNYCGQSLGVLCNFQKARYRVSQKNIVKTLLVIFLLVRTEWPNQWSLKCFPLQL